MINEQHHTNLFAESMMNQDLGFSSLQTKTDTRQQQQEEQDQDKILNKKIKCWNLQENRCRDNESLVVVLPYTNEDMSRDLCRNTKSHLFAFDVGSWKTIVKVLEQHQLLQLSNVQEQQSHSPHIHNNQFHRTSASSNKQKITRLRCASNQQWIELHTTWHNSAFFDNLDICFLMEHSPMDYIFYPLYRLYQSVNHSSCESSRSSD